MELFIVHTRWPVLFTSKLMSISAVVAGLGVGVMGKKGFVSRRWSLAQGSLSESGQAVLLGLVVVLASW